MTVIPSGQALNLSGITTGQTGRADPRIELLVGNLTIDAGGTATVTSSTAINGDAVVNVNGTLQVGEFTPSIASLNGGGGVQMTGAGALTIGSNDADSSFSGTLSGGSLSKNGAGILTLSGSAFVNAPLIINGGALEVAGVAVRVAALNNTLGGEVRIGAGERLRVGVGSADNSGRIEAIGSAVSPAEVEFGGLLSNAVSTGLITGRNAIMRFNGGLTNVGSLAVSTGQSDVFGDIDNSGSVVVSGGAAATFYDDIIQNGTLRVSTVGSTTSTAVFLGDFTGSGGSTGGGDIFFEGDLRPGNSPATVTFDNNVGFGSGVELKIELGGTTPGAEYDQVHVTGGLTLAGTLAVSLIDAGAGLFAPEAGDSFDILDWGSLSGTFAAIQLPSLAGSLVWNTSQLYSTGTLTVVAPGFQEADFDEDGDVDGNDLTRWRTNFGTGTMHLLGDADGDADADGHDFLTWQRQLGTSPAVVAGATVPEPGSFFLIGVALPFALRRRRRL